MTSLVHPIDVGILVVFLAVTLVVGLRYGRSVKTIQDYALGGKSFSTFTLTATIIATWISGSFLTFRIESIYNEGLYFITLYLCDVGTLVITGLLLAMRMGPFLQNTSIAEAMGDVYGKPVRTITAIFGLLVSIGLVALQLVASEKIFTMLLNWDSARATALTGCIVIIYSAFGGVRAVTFTDVFQFLTFGTLIPILALIIWNSTRDTNAILSMLQTTPQFNIKEFLTSPASEKRWNLLTLIPLYLIPAFSPPYFPESNHGEKCAPSQTSFFVCIFSILSTIALHHMDFDSHPDS